MDRKSLTNNNPHLRDPVQQERSALKSVASSSAAFAHRSATQHQASCRPSPGNRALPASSVSLQAQGSRDDLLEHDRHRFVISTQSRLYRDAVARMEQREIRDVVSIKEAVNNYG